MEEDGSKAKKQCTRIGTHNGKFHCDEVLACFLLRLLDEFRDAEIVRTRDPKLLDTCNVVVDVGGVYDHSKLRYDHHQRIFSDSMHSLTSGAKKWVTKLSSAGLVYLHYGSRVIAQLIQLPENHEHVGVLYDKVYENFIEEIDAIDNGIDVSEGELKYKITTSLSSRVGRLNPAWNEEGADENERFHEAVSLVGKEFTDIVNGYHKVWLPARSIVKKAVEDRMRVDSSGEIILLPQFCPWPDHLHNLEKELSLEGVLKYVVFEDVKGKTWRVQAVPSKLGSFENRLSLPEEWRGLRDDKLCEVSGIEGCVFVHTGGFIGGNVSREGAVEMARKSLTSKKI
jgi:uncharacterized UPF0160 family protein